eukprot:scaffold90234_cov69-Phaeocystis_antarctica.AAC.5
MGRRVELFAAKLCDRQLLVLHPTAPFYVRATLAQRTRLDRVNGKVVEQPGLAGLVRFPVIRRDGERPGSEGPEGRERHHGERKGGRSEHFSNFSGCSDVASTVARMTTKHRPLQIVPVFQRAAAEDCRFACSDDVGYYAAT